MLALRPGWRMPEALLTVTGVHAGYGATEVLRGVDLTVLPGEVVAVLGSNGVGKTTLNKALSGVITVRAGSVAFAGARIDRATAPAIVGAGLIHVPEGRRVFPNLSVQDNLILGSYRRGRPRRAVTLERVYGLFPRLRDRMRQAAGTLSGGEQQMLAIGRGMMGEPRLLILDEPSLGLSPLLVTEMFALIGQLRSDGLAILLVEQNVMQTLEVADRGYVMENGRCALSGPSAMLRADPGLRRAYLGL